MPTSDRRERDPLRGYPADPDAAPRPAPAIDPLEAAVTGGDADAIVVLCFARLRTLARRMRSRFTDSRRQEDTDDLLQNAALRMRRALAAVRVESPAHALALAVVQIKWELGDLIRRLRRRPDQAATAAGLDGNPVEAERFDAWEAFHEAVERLPKPERDAVHYLWYLGLEQERAAAILGVTSRTVRRHWRMARDSLRRRFDELDFRD